MYAGKDPLTGREIRFGKTGRTEVEAQIELGRLLELVRAGRQPDSGLTVAELLDEYLPVAGWDVSREANLGYIRRTIKPALGFPWLVRYLDSWWVLYEHGWLRVIDEHVAADLDHVAGRLAEEARSSR